MTTDLHQAPRLLIYAAPFFPEVGGMERFAEDLAVGLHQLGAFTVCVATATPASDVARSFPFPVIRTTDKGELRALFKQAHLILFVGLTFYEVMLATPMRRKVVLTHHHDYQSAARKLISALKRGMLPFFTNVSVSGYLADKLPGRHAVVHNSFRPEVFFAGHEIREPQSFAFVGRLVSDKGCDVLVRAFAEALHRIPAAKLTVIGNGPERPKLEELAEHLQCLPSITFKGSLSSAEVAETLRRTECLVVPSVWNEPFGITALEGLACGCEVIVTKKGGLPEAVGSYGWKVDATQTAICEAMCVVASGKSARTAGVKGFLQSHTQKAMALKYMELLNRRLSQR